MSWGVRCTGRGALHSRMVKTQQLMIIIIIPSLALPSFHPAGPCLAGPASPTSKASWGGVGQVAPGCKGTQRDWVSFPVCIENFRVLSSFLILELWAELLKEETEAQSQGMI